MTATLKIVDEYFGARRAGQEPAVALRLASQRVSAREIIAMRVLAEVEEVANGRYGDGYRGNKSYLIDVEGSSPEAVLNKRVASRPVANTLDAGTEIDRAFTAFASRRFIMLLDDFQIEDLDESVGLKPDSQVVFLYLTPLKGG